MILSIFRKDQRTGRKTATEAEMRFLQRRYPFVNIKEIFKTFMIHNCNLTKTCQYFNEITEVSNSVERTLLKLNFGEDFLKEVPVPDLVDASKMIVCAQYMTKNYLEQVSYILHAEEINKYLIEKEDRKLAETEWAMEENTFFECIVCYDCRVLPSDVLTCPDGHITCRPCLARYITFIRSGNRRAGGSERSSAGMPRF